MRPWRGLVAAAVVGLAALGSGRPRPALAQISPGPLAAAHGELEGALRCKACHGSGGKEAMTAQCLDCHREVAWLRARRLGLHGREARDRCASCHPDHAGADFELVTWKGGDSSRFDHRTTGWPLDGSHADARCRDCHQPTLRRSPAAALLRRRDPGASWVGLDRACATCHEDIHRGALASDCLECHDTREWQPAPRFEHDSTEYPLTGKHASTKCDACHLSPRLVVRRTAAGDPVPVYRPLRFRECSDCHRDPHAGALGATCGDCHQTAGFDRIAKNAFDHDRTRYPLRGRHSAVACEGCHDFSTAGGKRPAFATCTACHDDPHAGTATLAGRATDCASCHAVAGFRPASYTVAQHRSARYPLEGAHQRVTCSACHPKNPPGVPRGRLGAAGTVLRPASARCRDCHGDDHGPQPAPSSDCRDCHALAGWTPSTYGTTEHARTRLPLADRHGEIACSACHAERRAGLPALPPGTALGKARVVLRPPERECAACHTDAHAGRFAAGGASPRSGGCADCHDTRRFRPSTVGTRQHETLGFPLEGAHRAVPCVECHEDLRRPPISPTLVRSASRGDPLDLSRETTCTACHADPHGGQFAIGTDRARCESCHSVERFRPADRFDHDRDTRFSLKGAHATVTCLACHTGRRSVAGRTIVTYSPLPVKCESCHAASPGTP